MNSKILRHSFYFLSVILLFSMLYFSRNAGISCDEVLHYDHSLAVFNFFYTHGKDTSALNTPESHLKYYGQSYDNIVTFIAKWLKIYDVFGFRHLMSSVAGWLTIMITAFFTVWLCGYRAGIITLILFSISPTFMGHAQNNLKDVPFALGYIAGIFFSLRFIFSDRKFPLPDIMFMILSFSFSMSVRSGGLILFCYLVFFLITYYLFLLMDRQKLGKREIIARSSAVLLVIISSTYLSTLFWPFALQNPVKNIIESYNVMANFPGTFRQLFEGKMEWSDYMPWYYLVKSMIITIPLLITAGVLSLVIFPGGKSGPGSFLKISLIAFSAVFPILFVMIKGSNLYSSWRQFLFIYPSIVLLSATGVDRALTYIENKTLITKILAIGIFVLLAVHPIKYMISNPSFWYIYYNQLVGGLKGAYTNYETDYYYVSQTQAAEWLKSYLKKNGDTTNIKIKATFSVHWQFRELPGINTSYFRYEERSNYDWDYAVATSRYISPSLLKSGFWPPPNTIHTIYADSVPLCAVIKRLSKEDYYGYQALEKGQYESAIQFLTEAAGKGCKDEMIFFNLAAAFDKIGRTEKADSVLKEGLKINPDSEIILMYLGNRSVSEKRLCEAEKYYKRLISVNRKYYDAYISMAKIVSVNDLTRARELLRKCLFMNPGFRPAIIALGDTYRESDPDIAEKYYKLAKSVK